MEQKQETVTVPIRFPRDLLGKVRTLADEDGDSQAGFIRRAVKRVVRDRERRAAQAA